MVEVGCLWMKLLLNNMKYFCSLLMLLLFIFSCKPSFDIQKEKAEIERVSKSDLLNTESFKNRITAFFPEKYWQRKDKDSMTKIADSIYNILNNPLYDSPDYFSNHTVSINKNSNIIKADNSYFILINIRESFEIKKGFDIIFLEEIRNYLKQNLIILNEKEKSISVKHDSDLIGIYDKKNSSWNYFSFNERMLLDGYGLDITKNILKVYFKDIFILPKEPLDTEGFDIFMEIYEEIRNEKQFENIDFDEYCKCIYNYQEKFFEKHDFEEFSDAYFDSWIHLSEIYKCKIITTK